MLLRTEQLFHTEAAHEVWLFGNIMESGMLAMFSPTVKAIVETQMRAPSPSIVYFACWPVGMVAHTQWCMYIQLRSYTYGARDTCTSTYMYLHVYELTHCLLGKNGARISHTALMASCSSPAAALCLEYHLKNDTFQFVQWCLIQTVDERTFNQTHTKQCRSFRNRDISVSLPEIDSSLPFALLFMVSNIAW